MPNNYEDPKKPYTLFSYFNIVKSLFKILYLYFKGDDEYLPTSRLKGHEPNADPEFGKSKL